MFKSGKLLTIYTKTNIIFKYWEAIYQLIKLLVRIQNDTYYFLNLRLGIILSCEYNNGEKLYTSFDIIVKNSAKDKWLTIASYAFFLRYKIVYYFSINSLVIRKVESIFKDIDILLVKL